MEPSDCSLRASFKAWMGVSCLELQCDPERKLGIGKSRPTLVLNDLAQDFLSSAAYCPLANIRPCALQAEFQTQVCTTPDKHGTSKKPLLNMASVPPPYLLHHQWELLRAATGLDFADCLFQDLLTFFSWDTHFPTRWHVEAGGLCVCYQESTQVIQSRIYH